MSHDDPRQLQTDREGEEDIHTLHAPVMREDPLPGDNFEPVPVPLILLFFALLGWGGWYIGTQSAYFQPDIVDISELPRFFGAQVEDEDVEVDLFALGRRAYASCAACHGQDGAGSANFPPLAANPRVVEEDPDYLIRIVLHGLRGPLEVDGRSYDALMPAWGQLSDDEIAGVLTFIRQSWDNDGAEVSPDRVAFLRDLHSDRAEPWEFSEVRALEPIPDEADTEDADAEESDAEEEEG